AKSVKLTFAVAVICVSVSVAFGSVSNGDKSMENNPFPLRYK
ncbi:hypothetical protein D030_3644B, partial [Vibrio parahaemolyticus AQ3810]